MLQVIMPALAAGFMFTSGFFLGYGYHKRKMLKEIDSLNEAIQRNEAISVALEVKKNELEGRHIVTH